MELAEKRYIERPASFGERAARRAELARRRKGSVAQHGGAAAQEGAQASEGADRDTLSKLFDARIAHQARPQ